MARYKKILLALDFHQDNEEVVSRGIELAKDHGADVFLIHVNEPMAAAYGLDTAAWKTQRVESVLQYRSSFSFNQLLMGVKYQIIQNHKNTLLA